MATRGNALVDDNNQLVGVTSGTLLATVTGIDLKTVGQTTLFTVPAGKTAFLTDILLYATSLTGFAASPTVRVGQAAAYTEWQTGMMVNSLQTQGYWTDIALITTSQQRKAFAAADVVKLDVTTGATATTFTVTAYVFGFLL